MTPGGMIGGYCEDGFPLYFANAEIIRLMGYDSYEEFYEAIGGMVGNTIHPDDLERVTQDIGPEYYPGLEYTTTYRMPRKNGEWVWTLDRGKVVQAEDGRLAIVSACTDISDSMAIQEQLAQRNAQLLRQNQELQFLNSDIPGGYHRCARTEGHAFLYISQRFLDMFGYTRQELQDLFGNMFMNMVHPADREKVEAGVRDMCAGNAGCTLEYRMRSKRGYIWVIDQSKYLEYDGTIMLQGVVMDVTETVELRDRMRLLMENTPENVVLFNYHNGQRGYQVITNGLSRSLGLAVENCEDTLVPDRLEQLIYPQDLARLETAFAGAVDRRADYQDVLKIRLPDGKTMWTSIACRFVKEDQEGISYLCICHDVSAMKRKEQELWLVSKQMESILRQAKINSWEWDIAQDTMTIHNVRVNPVLVAAFEEMGKETAVITDFYKGINQTLPDGSPECRRFLRFVERVRAGDGRSDESCEVPIRLPEGQTIWLKTACETIRDENGVPIRAVGYFSDITQAKEDTREKRVLMQTLDILRKQAMYDFKANLTQNTLYADRGGDRWMAESGCDMEERYSDAIAKAAERLVASPYRERFLTLMDRQRLLQRYGEGKKTLELEYQRLCNGAFRWVRIVIHFVHCEESEDVLAYIFVMDIDEKKREELRLMHLAETDAMTGLFNRQTAVTRIKRYLADMADQSAALLLFDLDNFKKANDVFGHRYGDNIIVKTAELLKRSFREGDVLCRLGGDEFLILCKNIREAAVRQKLQQVVSALHTTLHNDGKELAFSISAGYVMIPEQGRTFEELYEKVDIALFNVKMGEKGCFEKYDRAMKTVRYELADRD